MLRLSPFRIQMFQQCRQLYKFFYLDDIKEHYEQPKPVIVMGEHVHRALERYYDLPNDKRSLEALHLLLRKSWVKNRSCFGAQEKEWGEKALHMLSLYYKLHNNDPDPWQREEYVDCTLRPDLVLLGKIDRVDVVDNGNALQVIDYKTGKEKEQTPEGVLQLLLYSVLVSRQYKKPVQKASFWYLATGKEHSISPTDDDMEAAALRVEEVADEINQEEEYPASPSSLCRFCDFQEICPAYQQG